MTRTLSRTVLALVGMLVCVASGHADGLAFSELESRLAKIEAQLSGTSGIQQAGYCGDSCCDSSCCETGCGDCCYDDCCNGCCDTCGGGYDCCGSCGGCDTYYAAVEFMFMRAHVKELPPAFKLSEEYELAPRFILGYENGCGQGIRLRYWHYGHNLDNISLPGLGVRYEWDVVDLELTQRLQFCRTDVVLAGGVRYASTDITSGNVTDGADLIGLTVAADVETLLCCDCCSYWSAIYGARLAILGGDWDRQGANLNRDDNMVVNELYAGVEYGCCYCGYDLYTQLKFEMQNWHSDFLAGVNAGNGYSVGFIGPAWTIGVGF